MVIKFDYRHKKFDGDLLLTLACPVECDFCVYSCTASKESWKWMPEETIRRVGEEYSKNDIGIRISGGEPFYDLEKLKKCMDILLEYYKPIELSIITSGFFAIDEKEAEKHLAIIGKKCLDRVVVSVDRFHQKRVPLSHIENILKVGEKLGIEIGLRITIDSLSYPLIDPISELIVKYKALIEINRWFPVGRAEKLDYSSQKDFDKVRNYFYIRIKGFASKYGAPENIDYYLTNLAKRSQRYFASRFFPTVYPNGNVYACSRTMKLGYMGNINNENLSSMISRWQKTLPGFFVFSTIRCNYLENYLPEKFKDKCEFCKNQPFVEKVNEESIGRPFIKITAETNLEELFKKLILEDKEYLISFQLMEKNLKRKEGIRFQDFLNKLKHNNIRFVLSRPLPKCLGITVQDFPKNCFECRELFAVENGLIKFCPNVYNIKGPEFDKAKIKNRKDIYELFKIEYNNLRLSNRCKTCIYFIRKQCNGLCFRGE